MSEKILSDFRLRRLYTPQDKGVFLDVSTIPNAGWGVFAGKDFEKGASITEYSGRIITSTVAKSLGSRDSHCRALYSMHYVIDGLYYPDGREIEMTKENKDSFPFGVGAFMNDSREKKTTNCVFENFDANEKLVGIPIVANRLVYIRAKRDIKKGEELFLDYGQTYWEKVEQREEEKESKNKD